MGHPHLGPTKNEQPGIPVETDEEMKEENSETTDKQKAFLKTLRDNQIAQAREALIQTLCENADQTIGSILDLLEQDSDGDFIMADVFKRVTIQELVEQAGPVLLRGVAAPAAPTSGAVVEDDFDEFDDDGLFDDDEAEEAEEQAKKKKKKKKKKNKSKKADGDGDESAPKKKKKKKKNKSEKGTAGDSAATPGNVGEKDVLACLRRHKARDEESALSSQQMQAELGADAPTMRALLDALIQAEKAAKCGKARGTKYFLA